jgi:ketosteroid isomerase-like protein
MRVFLFTIALVCLLSAIGISPAFAADDLATVKETIQKINKTFAEASIAGDWDTVFSYYLDDVVVMPHFYQTVKGKEAWMQLQKTAHSDGRKVESASFTTVDLWMCGDLVYEVGRYIMSTTLPRLSHPYSDQGKYLSIWQKQEEGSLRVKLLIWNTDQDFRAITDQLK